MSRDHGLGESFGELLEFGVEEILGVVDEVGAVKFEDIVNLLEEVEYVGER